MKILNTIAIVAFAAFTMAACNSKSTEEINARLQIEIQQKLQNDKSPYNVSELVITPNGDGQYKGLVKVKAANGNEQTYTVEAIANGDDLIFDLKGYQAPAQATASPTPAPESKPAQPATPAIQGSYSLCGSIYGVNAYLSINVNGNSVTGSYTADSYNYGYSAPISGTINGNKMTLTTREHSKTTRTMSGTVSSSGTYNCRYKSAGGGKALSVTFR